MALVSYSDSEGESERETVVPQKPLLTSTKTSSFKPLVARGNPRKIVVSLPDTKKIAADGADNEADGPAKKRQKTGTDSPFAGFNSLLPPPKRPTAAPLNKQALAKSPQETKTHKPFSLKTSATPGFDRGGGAGSAGDVYDEFGAAAKGDTEQQAQQPIFQKKGNAMMFRPLSVARSKPKRKTTAPLPAQRANNQPHESGGQADIRPPDVVPKPKPKVSLFGGSTSEKSTSDPTAATAGAEYAPLIYTKPSAGEDPIHSEDGPSGNIAANVGGKDHPPADDLLAVAHDLNLSKSDMQRLLGRKGQGNSSKILKFNSDQEYKANAEYLATASEAELAALHHNPVRTIAPGKHSLSQLVNAVTNQHEAFEESFAAGKRTKKEASSRYGW
ncbi:hypothetical protein FQN57_001629 [Myotisia sp. PD_48]|nr:hypothetical protein FQN57_001629 [Myotisia sp. PD_48]